MERNRFPCTLAYSSCQISAERAMVSCVEMSELFTPYPLVPFGGTEDTFSKGVSCHSA